MAYQVQGIDFGQAMQNAFAMRQAQQGLAMQRMQMDRAREDAAREENADFTKTQFANALNYAPRDQLDKILPRIDRDMYRQYKMEQYAAQKLQEQEQAAQKARQVEQLTEMVRVSDYALSNPESRPAIYEQLGNTHPDVMQQFGQRLVRGETEDELIAEFGQNAKAQLAQFQQPKEFDAPDTTDIKNYATPRGMTPEQFMQAARRDPRLAADFDRWRLEGRRAGAAQVSVGDGKSQPLRGVREEQEKIRAYESLTAGIGSLRDTPRELFTFSGQSKAAIGRFAEKLGIDPGTDARDILAARQRLTSRSRLRVVMPLLNSTSGKQLSDNERKFITDAVGDPGRVSETEFHSALDMLQEIADAEYGISSERLRGGIDLTKLRPGQGRSGNDDLPLQDINAPTTDDIEAEIRRRGLGG